MAAKVIGSLESLVADGAFVEANVKVVVVVPLKLFCASERPYRNLEDVAEYAFVSQII